MYVTTNDENSWLYRRAQFSLFIGTYPAALRYYILQTLLYAYPHVSLALQGRTLPTKSINFSQNEILISKYSHTA
jgi:hypothetical protein